MVFWMRRRRSGAVASEEQTVNELTRVANYMKVSVPQRLLWHFQRHPVL